MSPGIAPRRLIRWWHCVANEDGIRYRKEMSLSGFALKGRLHEKRRPLHKKSKALFNETF